MDASTNRLWTRTASLVALLILSWCVMLMTHEIGHILGGWLSGATLKDYDLRPWRLPYSIHDPDPRPLVTLWSGPLFGIFAPLLIAIVIRRPVVWLIAYFCMLANGVYIAAAWISGDRFLDSTMMLDNGTHPIWLALHCVVTVPLGYAGLRKACIEILTSHARKAACVSNHE